MFGRTIDWQCSKMLLVLDKASNEAVATGRTFGVKNPDDQPINLNKNGRKNKWALYCPVYSTSYPSGPLEKGSWETWCEHSQDVYG